MFDNHTPNKRRHRNISDNKMEYFEKNKKHVKFVIIEADCVWKKN